MLERPREEPLKGSSLFFMQVALFVVSALVIFHFQNDFEMAHETQSRILLRSDLMSHVVLGYNALAADLLWVRLIQDVTYKENDHVSKGWVFSMLDSITTLDPRYKIVYQLGASILSVLVHDAEGAAIIFDRGVSVYPNEWNLAYKAGYHYLFEVKDCQKAAEYFKKAEMSGGPSWIAGLSGRLFYKSGQFEIARNVIVDALRRMKDQRNRLELEKRLQELDRENRDSSSQTLVKGLNCHS